MTIGIAIATSDTVLLVADGRTTCAGKVDSETTEKITVIRDDLAVISFGAVICSSLALQWVQQGGAPVVGDEMATRVHGCVFADGSSVLQRVIPDPVTPLKLRVGLIAGGIDTNGAYLTGAVFSSETRETSSSTSRCVDTTLIRFVLGGEEAGASAYFDDLVKRTFASGVSDHRTIIPTLLQVAAQTVIFAGQTDPTIGGRIAFTLLRQGHLPQSGFLP